jgi:exoribonuclease R
MIKKTFHPPKTKSFWRTKEKASNLGFGKGKIYFSEKRTTIESSDGTLYYVFHTKSEWYIHGDIVEYAITRASKDGKLAEARPTKLIKRSEEILLMRISMHKGKISYHILESLGWGKTLCEIVPEKLNDGDIYTVRYISTYAVRIIAFFGSEKDPKIQEAIILFRSWVRQNWPESFERLAIPDTPKFSKPTPLFDFSAQIPNEGKIPHLKLFPEMYLHEKARLDLRLWPTMTIDGADAKDLDDAISIARYENGDFLLGVHIADVAEYVTENSDLDTEAYLRGTSIYTPGKVIPMLPEILSNDRCSLHPGSPKLTLSILMRVDAMGQVKESFVTESVIESMKKWIYDEIWEEMRDISAVWENMDWGIGGGNESKIKNQEWVGQNRIATPEGFGTFSSKSTVSRLWEKKENQLSHFSSLYTILEKRREKEGKILFEMTECYFDLDEERNVKNIRKRERNDAHMMIEEFMVLANEEIAKWCASKKIPFLSRVHEAPSEEKNREIREIIALSWNHHNGGFLTIKQEETQDITPHDIRKILEKARENNDLYRLSRLLLPKMAKAVYKDTVDRHFGLALKYYAHFTSPIRRYPDLLLHRMIKKYLHGELSKNASIYEKNMKKWWMSLSEKETQSRRSLTSNKRSLYVSIHVWQKRSLFRWYHLMTDRVEYLCRTLKRCRRSNISQMRKE